MQVQDSGKAEGWERGGWQGVGGGRGRENCASTKVGQGRRREYDISCPLGNGTGTRKVFPRGRDECGGMGLRFLVARASSDGLRAGRSRNDKGRRGARGCVAASRVVKGSRSNGP